jgi:predicted N-acetyltransferase YhbS
MADIREALPQHEFGAQEASVNPCLEVRRVTPDDYRQVSALARKNFLGPSFALFPQDVVQAYIAANRVEDIRHAIDTEGSEAYVAEDEHSQIVGFILLRHNVVHGNQNMRRNAYGELDLRRLHVDPTIQGKGIGTKLFDILENRAQDLNVTHITSHASGGSRPFFESRGWEGETAFNNMTKRGRRTRAIVFAAQKQIAPREIELFPPPTHIVYAGANERKANYVKDIAKSIDSSLGFVKYTNAQEDEDTSDVAIAAQSKARSTAKQIDMRGQFSPLIVAGDVRIDLLTITGNSSTFRYDFLNRGKPKGTTIEEKLQEVADNFLELFITAEETKKPAPYVVRSATCLLDPTHPESMVMSTHDSSIWLSKEGLEELATKEGVKKYREDAMNLVDADILNMSGGFCLPVFLERGYVKGINGHPIDSLPKKDQVIDKALHTAIVGIDGNLIKRRLGLI